MLRKQAAVAAAEAQVLVYSTANAAPLQVRLVEIDPRIHMLPLAQVVYERPVHLDEHCRATDGLHRCWHVLYHRV